jgi:hypothetical protein
MNPAIGLRVTMMDLDPTASFQVSMVPLDQVDDVSGAVSEGERAHDGLACHSKTTLNVDVARRGMKASFGLDITLDQIIAHELGHVFYWYSHPQGTLYSGAADDQTALDWENATRAFPSHGQRHDP